MKSAFILSTLIATLFAASAQADYFYTVPGKLNPFGQTVTSSREVIGNPSPYTPLLQMFFNTDQKDSQGNPIHFIIFYNDGMTPNATRPEVVEHLMTMDLSHLQSFNVICKSQLDGAGGGYVINVTGDSSSPCVVDSVNENY